MSIIGRVLLNTGHTDAVKYDKSGISGFKDRKQRYSLLAQLLL